LALGLGAVGCAEDPRSPYACGSRYQGDIRIATWWGALDSERNALEDLEVLLDNCNAGEVKLKRVTLQDPTGEISYKSKSLLRLDERELLPCQPGSVDCESPIDLMLLNGGADVKAYSCEPSVSVSEEDLQHRILPVDQWDNPGQSWEEELFPQILDVATNCKDERYALPIALHRLNTLFVNVTQLCKILDYPGGQANTLCPPNRDDPALIDAVSQALDLTGPPTEGLKRFLAKLSELDAKNELIAKEHNAGTPAIVTELGSAPPNAKSTLLMVDTDPETNWALSLLVFENVMIGLDDGVTYATFWSGTATVQKRTDILKRTLDNTVDLLKFSDIPKAPCPGKTELPSAADALGCGRAVFTVMGDWAAKDLESGAAANDSGEVIVDVPFPGTSRYIFSSDVMVVPRVPFERALGVTRAASAFALAATSREGQDILHAAKGSLSVLEADDTTRRAMEHALPGLTHIVPRGLLDAPPAAAHVPSRTHRVLGT